MQKAVTLFPHSISHSNNGERLISIEFLPLFNRFAVLFELSKPSSKSKFSNSSSSPFQFTMISPLWIILAVWGGEIIQTTESSSKEEDYSATYVNFVNSFEHQGMSGKTIRGLILHVELAAITRLRVQMSHWGLFIFSL